MAVAAQNIARGEWPLALGFGRGVAGGVWLKRGAGAGWVTPPSWIKVCRDWLCA